MNGKGRGFLQTQSEAVSEVLENSDIGDIFSVERFQNTNFE